MKSLWVVVPVHGREAITRVCLEQKLHVVAELEERGVECHVLVVGDDANIDTARELDFHTLERPNVLGRKLNDAIEWACREGQADYVSFVGSDDFVLPSFMARLPSTDTAAVTSRWAAFVSPAGDRLIVREVNNPGGNAPWLIPRAMLARSDFRPVGRREERNSGMDGAIVQGITLPSMNRPHDRAGLAAWREHGRLQARSIWEFVQTDELRLVDFKGTREQITKFRFAVPGIGGGLRYDEADVWGLLATRYPPDLVERMERVYQEGLA